MNNGLLNLGNTCYMNSILQCISHLNFLDTDNDILIKEFSLINGKNNFELLESLFKLNKSLKNKNNNGYVNPKNFYNMFSNKVDDSEYYFENFEQQDAAEFITILFDLLHKCLEHKISFEITGDIKNNYDQIAVDSINYWKKFFEKGYSCIIKQTYSQLLSVTNCPNCDYNTNNHDPIQYISLPIKENNTSIYNLLNNYTKIEKLDDNNKWKCDKCNNIVNPNKRIMYWKLSDILIIQLKLYNNKLNKVNYKFDYPEILDMNNYCVNYYNDNLKYQLYGICIQGGGLNFGHYYAICKSGEDWFRYNDESVNQVRKEDAFNKIPYCLFYKRI